MDLLYKPTDTDRMKYWYLTCVSNSRNKRGTNFRALLNLDYHRHQLVALCHSMVRVKNETIGRVLYTLYDAIFLWETESFCLKWKVIPWYWIWCRKFDVAIISLWILKTCTYYQKWRKWMLLFCSGIFELQKLRNKIEIMLYSKFLMIYQVRRLNPNRQRGAAPGFLNQSGLPMIVNLMVKGKQHFSKIPLHLALKRAKDFHHAFFWIVWNFSRKNLLINFIFELFENFSWFIEFFLFFHFFQFLS